MRFRSLLIIMLGMALAGFSVYASREFLQVQPATASVDPAAPALVSVVVAGQDIPFGSTIEAHKLTTIQWPADAVPPGTYRDYSDLIPQNGLEPRRAKRAMAQGELVLVNKISDYGEKVTIVQTLKPGNRAVAINVDVQSAVGGFVTPGDLVDILLTTSDAKGLRVNTILQNIRIIAVDQQADENQEQAMLGRTATVEVTPEQAQMLAVAQAAGRLSLTLRNMAEDDAPEDQPMESIRISDILREKTPDENPGPKQVVKVRRGAGDAQAVEIELEAEPKAEEDVN
ncbi:Flp pilus assembly protein CpaB [Silicimonas sp. MF1-12-2]|uniref:Flp pilus assembly protein CpaB n=1 Tax=Silicimonas sp. MF1-12-2 TaxID=3384793 RepID=UPI0039B5AF38